ncbi:zinc finger protein 436-like isoform X1 [Thunnus thynnus]|uniref:zinc finger protein 436-like isoform X1 n=1 Tax=Thunnus thynnus TaxID=8237 RepID=UPI003529B885
MPTQKECHICKEKIGVASKTCQHCGAKQPYKQKLEKRKKKVALDWKERQKKNCSVNKVYDATNLLLHKWELLERHPILLLARRTTNGFLAECFCPWQMDTEDAKDALVNIKKIYESLLYGNVHKSTEPPLTNSTVTAEEVPQENHESSTPAEPQTSADTENDDGNYCPAQTDFNISRIKEEQEELGDNSQTHTENDNGNYCLVQTDLNISRIKEEQEDLEDDSQTQQVIFTSPEVVKNEQDEPDTQATYEMQPVSSDCSEDQSEETDSDEDWVQSKGAQTKTRKRKVKVLQRQNGSVDQMSPDGDSPAKTQKDRSLCPVCGKGFQYIRPLMKHINTHKTNESAKELLSNLQSACSKRLVCDVCGKTFTSSGCLQMHSKIHAGIKDFKCQDCGKTFVRKEHLVVHVRTHSGVRPYHCDICGKGFSQSQNLRVHRRSHTGERPYCCSSCGKLFHTSGHLKTHMKRFSGEKPYTCDICDQFFCQREQLTQHKNAHTAE